MDSHDLEQRIQRTASSMRPAGQGANLRSVLERAERRRKTSRRRALIVGTVIAIGAAAVTAGITLRRPEQISRVGSSSGAENLEAVDPVITRTFSVGDPGTATGIATVSERLWVVSTDEEGRGIVTEAAESESGRSRELQSPTPEFGGQGFSGNEEALWIIGVARPGTDAPTSLMKVDGHAISTFPLPVKSSISVSAKLDEVWLLVDGNAEGAGEAEAWLLDPEAGQVTKQLPLDGEVRSLLATDTTLWLTRNLIDDSLNAVTGTQLFAIDKETGAPLVSPIEGAAEAVSLGDRVYAVQSDTAPSQLLQLDGATGEPVEQPVGLGNLSPAGIATGPSGVWLVADDGQGNSLQRFNPGTQTIDASVALPIDDPQGIAVGTESIWVLSFDGQVVEVGI